MRRGVIISRVPCEIDGIRDDDLIIACDAGYENCRRANIKPDLVIGDFDSCPIEDIPEDQKLIHLPKEKDVTDTEYALDELIDEGCEEIAIYGAIGGRLDMTLVTISLLLKATREGVRIYALHEDKIVFCLKDSVVNFKKEASGVISAFSLSEISEGVDEKGLRYELTDARLTSSEPIGVSNEFIGERASISVRDGVLLIITDRRNL